MVGILTTNSPMIRRDDLINTKQQELNNVVAGRKRKLRELHRATVDWSDFENINRDKSSTLPTTISRDVFLDLNDILKNRRFDIKHLSQLYKSSLSATSTTLVPSTTPDGTTNGTRPAIGQQDGSQVASGRRKEDGQPISRLSSPKKSIDQTQSTFTSSAAASQQELLADNKQNHAISQTDPTAQLLSEAARGAKLIESSTVAGIKRDHDTATQGSAETTQAKRRKDDSRQPIRIDTTLHHKRASLQGPFESPAPMTAATPERMTTRVSSGAIRHKSVSEILGETPRSTHPETSSEAKDAASQTPRTGAAMPSPNSAIFQSKLNEIRERDKVPARASTVVFPRQTATTARQAEAKADEIRRKEKPWEQKDYLTPLFYAQAVAQTPKLNQLVVSSKKTLSSSDHRLEYGEGEDCRILKRIYHLQNNNRWSLRQLERSKEPDRAISHWDAVIREAKWMRTDFREERRWKIAAAKNLADWCAEYHDTPEDKREVLMIKSRKPKTPHLPEIYTTPMSLPNNGSVPSSDPDPTPELIPSNDDDTSESADEDVSFLSTQTIAPAALFGLPPTDIVFGVVHTLAADKMLEELPLYQPWHDLNAASKSSSINLDANWRTPIAPVTKYVTGKMISKDSGPVRRKSRFSYQQDDEAESISSLDHRKAILPPEKTDVALFDPENRHIVARLHAAHAFRPPSEFAMPGQGFFEARQPSQWTINEDDQLRRLVREYEYNWSLISACMSSLSRFSSGAERRTPWECFERWVSFEGLPGDMAKHQYFRAWNSRREAAKEHLEQIYQAQMANPATSHLPPRRRSAEPVTVEKRKQGKYLSLFTIMSKVIKKREITLAKQQAAAATPPKKSTSESVDQRQAKMRTPREFSQHKHKQECEFREKRSLYQQQMLAQQRAAAMAKAAQANGQAQPGSLPTQQGRPGIPMQANGTGGQLLISGGAAGNRPIPSSNSILNMPNGLGFPNGQTNLRIPNGVSSAQMAAFMQQNPRMAGQPDPRVMLEAARVSNEQQRLAQQRQFQPSLNGAANMGGFPTNGVFPNAGKTSPIVNGMPNGNRSSSSPGNSNGIPAQQLSNGMVPVLNQVTSTLKAQHPNATPEQIMQMATITLNKQLQRQQQNNMAVNGNAALQGQMAFGAGRIDPQVYAQMIRNQQLQQARSASGGRSGSPNDQANRPGSQGSAMMQKQNSSMSGPTQSPRPPSAQMAGSS